MTPQACETPHNRPVPAETWSWVFGLWLCRTCLDMRSATEANRIPGARLDRLQRREADDHLT